MPAPAQFALLAVLAAVPALAQELEPGQHALLEQAREAALRYSDTLPDFLCTQVVHRAQDAQGNGRWRPLDKLTVKLSYVEGKEDYKLMLINGKPTALEFLQVGGALSTGEFGTRLYAIFDPRSHAGFRWKGWTTVRKRRAARFSFSIAKASSTYQIQFGTDARASRAIVVPYRGEVFVDEETHMVLRLTEQAEIPLNFPINANESIVDYDFAAVGGKEYLLPSHAYTKTRSGRFLAENNLEFADYRKFQADASISFDPPPAKQ